jgi:hypothetical protein
MTPAYAAEAFFGSPPGSNAPSALRKGLQNHSNWQTLNPAVAAQQVQGSADPTGSNYAAQQSQAQSLLNQYYSSAPAVALPVPFTGGDTSSASSSGACGAGGVVAGNIAQTAAGLSWPDGSHGLTPEPAYTAAITQYNSAINNASNFFGADCGGFVGTVMKASGADPSFPSIGTAAQEAYMRANTTKYQSVPNLLNTSNLQPGDIFVINANGGQGASGHTFIYIGPQSNGKTTAGASMGTDMPFQGNVFFNDNRGNYKIYRFIK